MLNIQLILKSTINGVRVCEILYVVCMFFFIKTKVLLPHPYVILVDFAYPLVLFLQTLLNYLAFQSFDFERIWIRLFQKRVLRYKFNIYVFIFIIISSRIHIWFTLLVEFAR